MKKLLVVDGNSILNRAYYGIRPLTTKEGLFTNAVYGMINILTKQLEALAPDVCAIAFDRREPTFRHLAYAEYKAGRHASPEELRMQFPHAKDCASAMGFSVIEQAGYEADDILGTLSAQASAQGFHSYLLTGDRDALQLIGDDVTVLLATNKDTIPFDRTRFAETYGVQPEQFVDIKALMGDSSDNIPGVAGIGEKTAGKLIAQYHDLETLYDHPEEKEIAKGVLAKLTAGREKAFFSRMLATIVRDAPLDMPFSSLPEKKDKEDPAALRALLVKLEFSALIKRLHLDTVEETPQDKVQDDCGCPSVPSQIPAYTVQRDSARLAALAQGCPCALLADPAHTVPDGICEIYIGTGEDCIAVRADDPALRIFLNTHPILVHDAKAVLHVLSDFGLDEPDILFDTMLAAYLLNPGESAYTPDRLALQYLGTVIPEDAAPEARCGAILALYPILSQKVRDDGMEDLYREIELPLARVLFRMEKRGFCVDVDGLAAYGEMLGAMCEQYMENIFAAAGTTFNVNSPKQLAEVLFDTLGLPCPSSKRSTNAEVLEKLRPYHPIVSDILEYRQVAKLRSTYTDGLLKVADKEGKIHSCFHQAVTATGRLSSSEPNLQNIPVRTELGRNLRKYFIPRSKDYVLIDADYSQIELRLLAAISGDKTMISSFINGIDIHAMTASQVFGVAPEAVNSEQRKRAKAVNFGIVYGIGDYSLSVDIGVTKKQAGAYIESYLNTYPGVAAYLKDIVARAKADGFVTTLYGRRRYIPELTATKKMLVAFGERVAMNSPIQGTAADIIKAAMVKLEEELSRSGMDARLILQVHDELIVECHKECAAAVMAIVSRVMENAASLSVPLSVDVQAGETWYDGH